MAVQRGDILLYQGKGWIAHIVRLITQSRWSHAAWVLDEHRVLEADWGSRVRKGGVVIRDLRTFDPARRVIVRLGAPRECVLKAVSWAEKLVGQKYGFRTLLRFLWRRITCWNNLWRIKPLRGSHGGWICSELIARPLYAQGWKLNDKIPPENVVPEDIWQAVQSGKGTIVL